MKQKLHTSVAILSILLMMSVLLSGCHKTADDSDETVGDEPVLTTEVQNAPEEATGASENKETKTQPSDASGNKSTKEPSAKTETAVKKAAQPAAAEKNTATAGTPKSSPSPSAETKTPNTQTENPSKTENPPKTENPSKSDVPSTFTGRQIDTAQLGALRYWLYTPSNPTENMPLIVYLHGGSGKGDDLNLITAVDGFPQYLQSGQLGDVRAYVLIPQLPGTQKGWVNIADAICELINTTVSDYKINKNNISLTGHSMGGTGTWNLACAYPNLFARVAPLSGSIRNTPDIINKLKGTPIRAFVGAADTIVPPDSSKAVIAAVKAAGGNAEITVFDGADHFSVPSLTYLNQNINLVGWLIGR